MILGFLGFKNAFLMRNLPVMILPVTLGKLVVLSKMWK